MNNVKIHFHDKEMISKPYVGNFYDGCLNEIKSELIFSVPEGKTLFGNGQDLVGNSVGIFNVRPNPYESPPAWIEITFENKYILPTQYFLEGRRYENKNFLKSWNFEGRTINGEWKVIHSQIDKVFNQSEQRIYHLYLEEVFCGFRLNMTDEDSNGKWALCPGQLEIFGNIYESIPTLHKHYCNCTGFIQSIKYIILS